MKKRIKNILAIGAGITAVTVGAAIVSRKTTEYLVKIALDREMPKYNPRTEKLITGSDFDRDFLDTLEKSAEELEKKPHETVTITASDGITLVGHWFSVQNPKRTIVAMHGWRSSWARDFGTIADFWLDNGCNVLFAEQRGQNNSGGDFIGFGLTERFDCLDWAKWVDEKENKSLPIYLAGVSMGATTVLMASGLELPENVHGIAADCGFTSPHDIWKHISENNLHIPYGYTGLVADSICRRKIQLGTKEYSTLDALKTNKIPVMFIHGAADSFVPVEMSYENYKACAAPKTIFIVPEANHAMSYYCEKEKYEKAVKEFWKNCD